MAGLPFTKYATPEPSDFRHFVGPGSDRGDPRIPPDTLARRAHGTCAAAAHSARLI